MIKKIRDFVKKEYVICISAFFAVVTMFIVPPDAEYAEYIDFRVLCLLMCLMAVVAGLKNIGTKKDLCGVQRVVFGTAN